VFVIGAGVAGLQAIATAKRLGAVVSAIDVRPAVKEQVESLGAKFVMPPATAEGEGGYAKELTDDQKRKQQELIAQTVAESDVVITTAAIPGRKAPVLVTAAMVKAMPPGSVVVDLAAERGGNCELTDPGKTIVVNGVTIIGPDNMPSTVANHASQMYSKNITTFLNHLVTDGAVKVDTEDEITAGTLIARDGEVAHPRVRDLLGLPPEVVPSTVEDVPIADNAGPIDLAERSEDESHDEQEAKP
jgi:NAD(P) transhydrogenase subunit alpha